eukprot:jgi/Ulvmu1/4538/UM002_0264.1
MMAPVHLPSFPTALAVSVAAASLGGLKVGFDLGVLNPCMSFLSQDLSLLSWQEGFVMVLLIVSAAGGALGAGKLADSTGMISAQLLTAVCGGVGTSISAAAYGPAALWIMCLGRLVAGIGCGACTVLCPRYIAEVSPPIIRGALSCATQLSICLGLLLAYLLGLPYEHDVRDIAIGPYTVHWWRVVHIIGALISLTQILMLASSVESPVWLEHHGRHSQAQANKARLQGEHTESLDIDSPLDMDAMFQTEALLPTIEEEARARPSATLGQILSTPQYRYSAFLALSVAIFQQFSGINTVMLYSANILEDAGLGSPIMATVLVGVINTIMTLLTAGLVDRHGRRIILLISHAGCAISLGILALSDVMSAASVLVIAMLAFVAFFAVGAGPVPFMYMSEILSPEIKGVVASAAMTTNWVCNVTVVGLFPMAARAYGLGPTYSVFVIFNGLAVLFCAFCMIETKQLSMKEIQDAMKRAS